MPKAKPTKKRFLDEFDQQFQQLTVGKFYRLMSQKYGVGCVVINYLTHPVTGALLKVASYALPTNNDLTAMDRLMIAGLNPKKSIAYVRLTLVQKESVLVVTHLKDPIMGEIVNVHIDDNVTIFK